jgi:hypothetical protein
VQGQLNPVPATPPTQAAKKKRRQKTKNENSAFNSYLLICVGIGAVLVQLGLVESRKKYKYNDKKSDKVDLLKVEGIGLSGRNQNT